jgi:hypothetical protein
MSRERDRGPNKRNRRANKESLTIKTAYKKWRKRTQGKSQDRTQTPHPKRRTRRLNGSDQPINQEMRKQTQREIKSRIEPKPGSPSLTENENNPGNSTRLCGIAKTNPSPEKIADRTHRPALTVCGEVATLEDRPSPPGEG